METNGAEVRYGCRMKLYKFSFLGNQPFSRGDLAQIEKGHTLFVTAANKKKAIRIANSCYVKGYKIWGTSKVAIYEVDILKSKIIFAGKVYFDQD